MLPKICVITPSYNARRYIGDCVRSVLAQDYPNLDYLVMDGGSTDGTVDVLRSFGDRVRYISQRDKGQSDALNRGFASAGAKAGGDPDEVLGWLNADDTFAPGALAHVADIFAARPEVDVAYGLATYIDARGKHIARCTHIEPFNRDRLLRVSDFIVQPATFFRRRAFESVGGVDVSLNWMMDWDLWIKFAKADRRFVHTPRVLAHFRWISDNKTASGGSRRLDEIDACLARHGLPRPAFVQLERCNVLLVEGLKALATGRFGTAAAAFTRIGATLVNAPRAAWSLLDVHTWNVIWTGQVLRARAAAADRRREGR